MSFEAKRCGVQFSPPSIVLIYQDKETQRVRKRVIPVRSFSQYSDSSMAAERLKSDPRHRSYLENVSQLQLEKLHVLLRDHLQGVSLESSLASFCLDPDEDLNKLDDDTLSRRKSQMDAVFQRNRRRPDHPDFLYDVEKDFSSSRQEDCSWDDESDDGF